VKARLRRLLGSRARARPDRSPASTDGFTLSEPLDDAAIRRLYDEQVLTQEFYGDAYVSGLAAFVSAAAEQLAQAIVATFQPGRVLDVGCGLGQLVLALRRLGVDATGCDYSTAILDGAPKEVRPHLHQQDVTELERYRDDEFDLVLCMEVLEHLPVELVHRCVAGMKRVSAGPVVVTTPSFGPNWPGPSGLPLNTPSWRADALAGSRFSQIVIAPDGRPHHGHLTLASYAWWTRLFAGHGLVRNQDIENAWLEHAERPLRRHRWNIYVLHEAREPEFCVGSTCVSQGNYGWHQHETWGDERVRWTDGRAALTVRAPCEGAALRLRLWGGPDALLFPRELDVAVEGLTSGIRGTASVRVTPGEWVELLLSGVPAGAGELVSVRLTVPEPFRPWLLDGSADHRRLGVAVSRVALEAPVPGDDRADDAIPLAIEPDHAAASA
jgi:2-polyprenyl-3-methyl-5-hydroxy-6-metoxy-1,4-benzoquinol methylase